MSLDSGVRKKRMNVCLRFSNTSRCLHLHTIYILQMKRLIAASLLHREPYSTGFIPCSLRYAPYEIVDGCSRGSDW